MLHVKDDYYAYHNTENEFIEIENNCVAIDIYVNS